MLKDLVIICLLGGLIGFGLNLNLWKQQNKELQKKNQTLLALTESYKAIAIAAQINKAKSIVQAREEHFIANPGRLHPREVDLYFLISTYLKNNDRICFGKDWLIQGKELD